MTDAKSNELRMHAYYYGFGPTGVPSIDKILSAVACAGKAFHHTEQWTDNCTWPPHEGNSPVDWIANAAKEAAAEMARLQTTLQEITCMDGEQARHAAECALRPQTALNRLNEGEMK